MRPFIGIAFVGVALASLAAEEQQRETFGKWRIGVGAAFNCGVRARVGMRNLPLPRPYSVPFGSSKADAWDRANAHVYDGGGFISPDSLDNGFATENWRLPVADYHGNGVFDLGNAYQEVLGSSFSRSVGDSSDAEMQYGLSVEVSRELWIHDENDEHRWGVDFAAAFSYFFRRDIYDAQGAVTRTDSVRDGDIRTPVDDPDAMWRYDHGLDLPTDGMYGHGNFDCDFSSPALGWDMISPSVDIGGPIRSIVSSCGYNASGDYRELEMLFMLRPWYEIKDWWRVFGELGVGVSWGKFETSFDGGGIHADEDFAQWDCYGVAGLGTAFRYGHWDLGIDFLGRFWRDDLEVEGRYARGAIERADWGFRVMLSYSF